MGSEELGLLRLALRRHLEDAPVRLDQIKDYLGEMEKIVRQIEALESSDRDAQEARGYMVELEQLQGLNQRATGASRLLAVASEDELDIEKADKVYTEVNGLFSLISNAGETGAKETFAQHSALADQLFANVLLTKEKSRKHREKVQELTGKWRTVRGADRKEDLELWLQELAPHARAGRRVPYDRALLGEIAEQIGPNEDAETISSVRLVRLIRNALISLCLQQAERLYDEAQAYMPPSNLEEVNCQTVDLAKARNRYETGTGFIRSTDADTHQDQGLQEWRQKYDNLAKNIDKWEEREKEAGKYLERARDAGDPYYQRLDALQTARTIFPCLKELEQQTAQLLEQLKTNLDSLIEDAEKQVREECGKREYDSALTKIGETQREVKKHERLISPTLAKRLDAPLDLDGLKTRLEKNEESVRAEREIWRIFKLKKEQLDNELEAGSIRVADLEDVRKRFTDNERKLFAAEWTGIEVKLIALEGDRKKLEHAKSKELADVTIVSIIEGIPSSSSVYQEAQQLLFQHYLAYHRKALACMLEDGSVLTDTAWKEKGQRHYEEASRYGHQIQPKPEETLRHVKSLYASVETVWNLKVEIGSGNFSQNKQQLEQVISEAGGVELKQAIRFLLAELQRRWRMDLWTFINDNVIDRETLALKADSHLEQGLEKVKLLEKELVGLIEEGDTRVFEAVKYYWHEEKLLEAVGIQAEGKYQAPADEFWHDLRPDRLREIRGYADKVSRESAISQRRINIKQAGELFQISSGYLALNQSRDEAIQSLEEQRKANRGRLLDNSLLCVLLIWRQLEQLPEGLKEARKVIAEVQSLGPYTQRLVANLEKLLKVHQEYQDGAALDGVTKDIKQALAAFHDRPGGFWSKLAEASTWRTDEWREQRIRQLFDVVDRQSRELVPAAGSYAALSIARVVLEILALQSTPSAGLNQAYKPILGQLKGELDDLCFQVTEILNGNQGADTLASLRGSLADMVIYTKTAVAWQEKKMISWEDFEKSLYEGVIEWLDDEAEEDLKELQTRFAVVERAVKDMGKVTDRLKSLLDSKDWIWNVQPKGKPLNELSLASGALRDIENRLNEQQIPITGDVRQYKMFVRALQRAAQVLGEKTQRAVDLFEGDKAQNRQDFVDLTGIFADLEREMNEQQPVLSSAKPLDLQADVDVHKYFMVEDIYGYRTKDERLASLPEKILTIARAKAAVETRRKSWEAWKEWSEQVMQELAEIEGSMGKTSMLIQGHLSEAEKRCLENHPQEIKKLRNRLNSTPDHPMCELAQKEALKLSQYQSNIGASLRQIWLSMNAGPVSRLDICSRVKAGLGQEIEVIERHLGKMGEQSNPSLRGQVYVKKVELEKLFHQLERALPQGGQGGISEKRAQTLENQIAEAERIDKNHARIGVYRGRLQARRH